MNEIVIYEDGTLSLDARVEQESVWLNQKQMASLFDVDSDTVSYHLKNIYKSNELGKDATTEKISVVQQEGQREVKRRISFYNLDAIISVGYRINSQRATKFRIWATSILKDYIIQGYTLSIILSKTTPLPMAINASVHFYLSYFFKKTKCSTEAVENPKSMIMLW